MDSNRHSTKMPFGLDRNTAGALSYLPLVNIVFLFLFKNSSFIRFNAMQSLVFWVVVVAFQWIFSLIFVLSPMVPLLSVGSFTLWLVFIYKAWLGEEWEFPVIGAYARTLLKKM